MLINLFCTFPLSYTFNMECLRNKTRVLAETVIFFVFGRYILWLWVSNIKQFLYWLLFPSFSWAALQLNRRCVFFNEFENDIHRALWKYCWSSSANLCCLLIWIFLPGQKNINFINRRFWRRFSELLLQRTNFSQQQIFQTHNLMETIHS